MISTKPSYLVLKNGHVFEGRSPLWVTEPSYGEAVFTTGMTGYPESLTDPSYAGQLLTFTYPLIGNYGVPSQELWESYRIHAHGVIVSEVSSDQDHHAAEDSFPGWLEKQGVPLIEGVDTRALTKMLRSVGSMPAVITPTLQEAYAFMDINQEHLVKRVAPNEKRTYGSGKKRIIAFDCGMKENIIRSLEKLPATIDRVPYNYDLTHEEYDGLFISNGPGDPTHCPETIAQIQMAFERGKPIFGICLGTQILALAAGAKTYKLPFGHRGQNQPVIDLETGHCYITSQNHGYAVDPDTLPSDWRVSFTNLNDQSVEGIAHRTKPFFAVQFHPEATPGPTDTLWLFQRFYEML